MCPGGGERRGEGRVVVGTLGVDEANKNNVFHQSHFTWLNQGTMTVLRKSKEISGKVQCILDKRNAGKFAKMNIK